MAIADLDFSLITKRKRMMDSVGHYARPELLSLRLNADPAIPMSVTLPAVATESVDPSHPSPPPKRTNPRVRPSPRKPASYWSPQRPVLRSRRKQTQTPNRERLYATTPSHHHRRRSGRALGQLPSEKTGHRTRGPGETQNRPHLADQRWDTFCLVTPNWQCNLPGFSYSGKDPSGFMGRDEIVQYVERFASSFGAPVLKA